MLRQFITRLSAVRPNIAIQSTRFYSAPATSEEKVKNIEPESKLEPEEEEDKLYKRLEIELRGHDKAVIASYVKFASVAATHLNIEVGKSWRPRYPYQFERYTLLKSAFVHKKHRVQYEFRTYFHFINFHRMTGSTLSVFLEYIERNLPEGVALKATKIELLAIPEHLKKAPEPVKSEQTN